MTPLVWIVAGGFGMSLIALVGVLALVIPTATLDRWLWPLVAFAAGTLLGGALFHMLPGAIAIMSPGGGVFLWVAAGFVLFFALEQMLHWHQGHRGGLLASRRPLTYLVLLGDGLHNLLGGFAVGAAFIADPRLGLGAWLAAAAHEVPQELGDFAVLVHGGWKKRRALAMNLLSASTFLVGGLLAWGAARTLDLAFLLPLTAGNFLYIAASDLVPEIREDRSLRTNVVHLLSLVSGLLLLYLLRVALES